MKVEHNTQAKLARELGVSRQYIYQQVNKEEGLCTICRAKRNLYVNRCDNCQKKERVRQRLYTGCKPYRKGKAGRPPKK